MSENTVFFTVTEIMQQIQRELVKLGADTESIPLSKWLEYILARAIEDVLLIDLIPAFDGCMEPIASVVRANYRRDSGEVTLTIQEDVGSNKLFPYLGSGDLSFESRLELHRRCVVIGPRKAVGKVQ
jgi:hypothetical protein